MVACRKGRFLPRRAISRLFRRFFLTGLAAAFAMGKLAREVVPVAPAILAASLLLGLEREVLDLLLRGHACVDDRPAHTFLRLRSPSAKRWSRSR